MKDVVECSHGPACRGDHHGWDCPVSDPMGDVLRPLMDHFTNPILDQSRRALIDGFTNQEGSTVSKKDKDKQTDEEVIADAKATLDAEAAEFYALPGCKACGGIAAHQETCAAYDPDNVMTVSAGWCAPTDAVYDMAGVPRPPKGRTPWSPLDDEEDDAPTAGLKDPMDWQSIISPPRILQPVPTLEDPLDIDQLGRVEALKAARAVLQTSAGLFGGTSTGNHSVDDLIRIARFITTGQDPQ